MSVLGTLFTPASTIKTERASPDTAIPKEFAMHSTKPSDCGASGALIPHSQEPVTLPTTVDTERQRPNIIADREHLPQTVPRDTNVSITSTSDSLHRSIRLPHQSLDAASPKSLITHDPQESNGSVASAFQSRASDAAPFSLDTRPSQLTLDSVRKAKGVQNYESVVLMDEKWTEIWCGQCGRNATIDIGTKMPRFFGSAIGLINHVRSHFNEQPELRRLAPLFEHVKRRHVSDEDVALMKAGKEPTVAITKRTEDPTKSATPKKRKMNTPQHGTSVSPGSSFDTSSPSKKQVLGGIGLGTTFETTHKDYGRQQRERDDEEPLPEAKSSGA